MGQKENADKDEEIVSVVKAGNIEIFGVLVRRYEEKLIRYARKFLFNYQDREEIVQEVFIKAYKNIQSFDTSKKFSSWLYRIAHNEFINAIKKKHKEPILFFDTDTIFPHPVSPDSPEKEVERKEIVGLLDKCLDKLDEKYREPLILYYLEEFDYKEIADILHVPTATVGIRLKRGKEKIKVMCEKLNYYYER